MASGDLFGGTIFPSLPPREGAGDEGLNVFAQGHSWAAFATVLALGPLRCKRLVLLKYLKFEAIQNRVTQDPTFAMRSAAFLLKFHCLGKVHLRGSTWHGGSDDATFASLQPSLITGHFAEFGFPRITRV